MFAADDGLAGVRPQLLQIGGEHPVGAELSLDAHRRGDIGQPEQVVQVGQREHQLAEHAVGAVDERQPLLLGEGDRGQAVRAQRVGGRLQFAVAGAHLPLPHDRERDVRQRREITRTAEASVLVDHRRQARRQQVGVGLGGFAAHAGPTAGQRRQPQQHHRAHHLALDLGAGTGRM